jgi:single-stranded DNA-binding protein
MVPHRGVAQARGNQRKIPHQRQKVAIEGKLVHRIYETKYGEKRYITEVNCDELMIL